MRNNFFDRYDCESLTPPMVLDETTPVETNVVFNRSAPIDRGSCEVATSPMVFDEEVPILYDALWVRSDEQAHNEEYSYKCTKNIAAGDAAIVDLVDVAATDDMHGLVAGQTYTFSAWVYIPSGGIFGSEVTLIIYDYQGGWAPTITAAANVYDAWQKVTVTRTIRAAATGIIVRFMAASSASINEYFYVDDVKLDHARGGKFSYRLTKTIAAGTAGSVLLTDSLNTADMHGLLAGHKYTFGAWVYIPLGGIKGSEITFQIGDYVASWDYTSQAATDTYDAWQYVEVTHDVDADATGIVIKIEVDSDAATGEYFFVDKFLLNDWLDWINKPFSKKKILVEISSGLAEDFWLSEEPGIWYNKLTVWVPDKKFGFGYGVFGYGSFGNDGTDTLGHNAVYYQVGSVKISGVIYTEYDKYDDCVANSESWYYDIITTKLYLHFLNDTAPWEQTGAWERTTISIGLVAGFSNHAGYYNDIYYDARVISIPNISYRKNWLFFGIARSAGGEVTLDNSDGYFDNFATHDIFGHKIVFRFGVDDIAHAQYLELANFYIDKITVTKTTFSIALNDKRSFLQKKIPINVYDSTTYPDIKDTNENKPIRLGYGTNKKVPCVCTNEEEAIGGGIDYTFKICDVANPAYAISAITTVYIDDVVEVPKATNLNTATFTIASGGNYTKGDKVTCTYTGYTDGGVIDNALDVIADLLNEFNNDVYNSTNFNTTAWAIAKALAYDIGFPIEKETVGSAITKIANTVHGSFLIQGDDRYSFKIFDEDTAAVKTITGEEILKLTKAEYDTKRYLTRFEILYDRDWDSGFFRRIIEESNEEAIFTKYGVYREKEFETLLISADDSSSLASKISKTTSEVVPYFSFTTKSQNFDLMLTDLVNVELNRVTKEMYGTVKLEIVGIVKDMAKFTTTIIGRYIKNVD